MYSIVELLCLLKYVKAYVCSNELHDSLVCEFGHSHSVCHSDAHECCGRYSFSFDQTHVLSHVMLNSCFVHAIICSVTLFLIEY